MREHLEIERETKISELCFASDVGEKMFWQLIKGKRCSSQLGSFMIDGRLTNSPQEIIEICFNHFKILGCFGQDISFDENFRHHVATSVLREPTSDLNHDENLKSLNKQIELSEIVSVCKDLTDGTAGGVDQTVHEHDEYGGPHLWKILSVHYTKKFDGASVPSGSLMEMILLLFKGKGLKACEKDNYMGITMFPVILKVFEVILLRRLENFAKDKAYFSHLQLGFSAGSVRSEASFVIMEAINHIKEREGKVFACFLDVRKTFDTVWIDGLFRKLFLELGVEKKTFAMIKTLYTDVESFVYFNGVSTQAFLLYQGYGQGRILAHFMYKVYFNRLVETVCNSKYSLVIDNLIIGSATFADDMTLSSISQLLAVFDA